MIVIGSGAGGGTLVHRLAPSGKRILLLERGDWLPREPQNWLAQDVFVDEPLRLARHLVLLGRLVVPAGGALLRRRRDQAATAPRCTGCARRTSASCATTAGSRRRGRSPTRRWSRTTRRPSSSTRCTARAARIRPSRRRARRTRSRRCRHEPRIQQLSDDLAKAGLHPFHAPCGILLDESQHAVQQVRALR